MTHALKTWPEFYKAIDSGEKTFEIRRFDRPFKVGDRLLLQEWDNVNNCYTGKEMYRKISFIITGDLGALFGIANGYCVMSITEIEMP